MANRRWESQFLYTMQAMEVLLQCSFEVDADDSAGLGIVGLVGAGIQNAFMHTSATPGRGNAPPGSQGIAGYLNPNPSVGVIMVQLQDNFRQLCSFFSSIRSPNNGSGSTSVTNHSAYIITSLGTATLAQWVAVGLPVGMTPAVGQAFVATATQSIGGSAQVQQATVSGLADIEIIGNPNVSLSVSRSQYQGGGWIILQCLAATNSSTTTLIPAAPAEGSIINLNFGLSNSSVQIQGQ